MKHLISLLLAVVLALPLHAQSPEAQLVQAKHDLEQAYYLSDIESMKTLRTTFERATQLDEFKTMGHYYVALIDYRLMNLPGTSKDDKLDYIDSGLKHTKAAIKDKNAPASAHALRSSFFGQKAGLRPMTGMINGPRANNAMDDALNADPNDPRVLMIGAISDYFTPEMWGGDKERAMENIQAAVALFEAEPKSDDNLTPDWGHAEALAWLGMFQMKTDLDAAESAFNDALDVAPNFGWVRYALLPQVAEAR
ncbi:MAG: tetratricopeptide repeat protein [Rhodothermales bacterium]